MPEGKGIYVPRTGTRKYIKDFTIMVGAGSATSTASDGVFAVLCDYVYYYPFIDLTSTELQELDNTNPVPRYADGRGMKAIMILQQNTANLSTSNFTMNYVNQDGNSATVTGYLVNAAWTTNQIFSPVVSGSSTSQGRPFMPLAVGDSGLRSITSVQLSADWGGLAAIVLVKPLMVSGNMQGCRRTTSGALDSFGSPVQTQNLIHSINGAWIEDGAYLTPFVSVPATGANLSNFVGTLETVWND